MNCVDWPAITVALEGVASSEKICAGGDLQGYPIGTWQENAVSAELCGNVMGSDLRKNGIDSG